MDELRNKIRDAQNENTFRLHRKRQMPILRKLHALVYNKKENLSEDEISNLCAVDEPIEGVLFDSKFFISKGNQKRANSLFKEWYIKSASEIIIPKAVSIAGQIGVRFNSINILDLKYRWGSCTPKDNIHFNWRLIKAPMAVIEYIIIHELTHLLEANHTPEFWNRVRTAYPSFLSAKKWLKIFGYELEIDF